MKEIFVSQVKSILEKRRNYAELTADKNLEILLKQKDFYQNYTDLAKLPYQMGKALYQKDFIRHAELKKEQQRLQKEQQSLLSKYGMTQQSITPQYSCTLCNDRGYVEGKTCQCYTQEMTKLLFV